MWQAGSVPWLPPVLFVGLALSAPISEPAPQGEAEVRSYDEAQAKQDVATILTGTGQDYLKARARLTQNPTLGARALVGRLQATPPPIAAERKRILDVLAELGQPEHLRLFADELRNAVAGTTSESAALDAAAKWRPLLVAQGSAAVPYLTALIGDTSVPTELRAVLLEDLVTVQERAKLPELVGLLGRGDRVLDRALRAALLRRAQADPDDRAALFDAAEGALEKDKTASLLLLRAGLAPKKDGAFSVKMAAIATNERAWFTLRVAAVRILGDRSTDVTAKNALLRLANATLPRSRRQDQAAEILGWLALRALSEHEARQMVQAHGLLSAEAPRLAATAYRVAALPQDGSWIEDSQTHPWPQVRAAALERVEPPCGERTQKQLLEVAEPVEAGGDREDVVARAAIAALGRCEAIEPLQELVEDRSTSVHRRGDAALALVKHGGSSGAAFVAKLLAQKPGRKVAIRMIVALQHADPEPAVLRGLCAATRHDAHVANSAHRALAALFPDTDDHCGK
jgi:hypothetical protein